MEHLWQTQISRNEVCLVESRRNPYGTEGCRDVAKIAETRRLRRTTSLAKGVQRVVQTRSVGLCKRCCSNTAMASATLMNLVDNGTAWRELSISRVIPRLEDAPEIGIEKHQHDQITVEVE